MYKILLLTCGILIVSFVARTNDCAKGAGTIVTGNNGTAYCQSKNHIN